MGSGDCSFQKKLKENVTSDLSSVLGIAATEDLGMDLGAPLIHKKLSKKSFTFILDKMRKKLSGWKSNSLSFTGRVTLAQASLSNIQGM